MSFHTFSPDSANIPNIPVIIAIYGNGDMGLDIGSNTHLCCPNEPDPDGEISGFLQCAPADSDMSYSKHLATQAQINELNKYAVGGAAASQDKYNLVCHEIMARKS